MAKKSGGIFGKRVAFTIGAPTPCSAGGQAAAAPPPGLLNSSDHSSTTSKTTPGLHAPTNLSTPPPPHPQPQGLGPKNSSSSTTASQRPPFSPELQHAPKNSSSATTKTPAPSTSQRGISPSSLKDPSLHSCAAVEDEGPLLTGDESTDYGPLKLLASKRTYLPSPNGCDKLNSAAASGLQFSHQMEKKTEFNIQNWDEDTEENDLVLELLASNKIYHPYRPVPSKTLQCKSLTEYGKTGSSSIQQNGIPSHSEENIIKCCCHTHPMSRLDQFLLNKELTKIIELPGTSRSCRVATSARLETRLILRRSIRLVYKLHREGYCLEGSFGLASFFVDENLFVTLHYSEEDRKNYSKPGAQRDLQSFVKMIESEIFESQDIPNEIMQWLSLIKEGGTDYEYLVSHDCALMEYNQVLSTFMQLYSKLQAMEKSDYIGFMFVLVELNHFNGWSEEDLHNDYFIETYQGKDNKKRKWQDPGTSKRKYGSDVMSMLRLIRNTFQHITLKRIDKRGKIIFDEEYDEYILHDQFPKLIAELMEAMYIAAHLADLNLEHVMV